jgi:hypothetical protein
MRRRGALPAEERLPVFVEIREWRRDVDRGRIDAAQPGCPEEFRERLGTAQRKAPSFIQPADGSTPVTVDGAQWSRIAAESAPVPQPTSTHRRAVGTPSHSRKRGATRRLQRPT